MGQGRPSEEGRMSCALDVRNHPLCAGREQGSRLGKSVRPETARLLGHERTGVISWGISTVREAQRDLR